jgi:hypothetical protein
MRSSRAIYQLASTIIAEPWDNILEAMVMGTSNYRDFVDVAFRRTRSRLVSSRSHVQNFVIDLRAMKQPLTLNKHPKNVAFGLLLFLQFIFILQVNSASHYGP